MSNVTIQARLKAGWTARALLGVGCILGLLGSALAISASSQSLPDNGSSDIGGRAIGTEPRLVLADHGCTQSVIRADEFPPTPSDKRRLGFEGPSFGKLESADAVVVLPKSIRQASSTNHWQVAGLLRNQTRGDIVVTKLSASLFGVKNQKLGDFQAWTPIQRFRPGEVVPFVVEANVSVESVHSVSWNVQSRTTESSRTAPVPNRDFVIQLFLERPFSSDGRAVGEWDYPFEGTYPFRDPSFPPFPYVVAGHLCNAADRLVSNVHVLIALLDAEGGVLRVGQPKILPGNLQEAVAEIDLRSGELVDFAYTDYDPAVAAEFSDGHATVLVWGVGQ